MDSEAAAKRQELARGWPVIVASFIGIMAGIYALPFYMLGPLTGPLQADQGWNRTSILLVASFLTAGQFLGTPIAGRLTDRFGARRTATVSMTALALGMASLALWMKDITTFRVGFFCLGLLCAGSGSVSFTRAVGAWFVHARGVALGFTMAGTGVSAFMAPLLVEFAAERGGWRVAMLTLAALSAIAAPIVWWGLRGEPKVERPVAGRPATGTASRSVAWGQALKDARFYVLAVALTLLGLFVAGIVLHIMPMLTDQGLSPRRAAAIASLNGIGLIVGRILTGWLLDRFSATWVAFVMFIGGGAGCLSLVLIGPAAAPVMVLAMGLMVGSEVDLLSFLCMRYFGLTNYGAIYGALFALFMGWSLISPQLAGSLVHSGGFPTLFLAAATAFAVVALLFLLLGRLSAGKAAAQHASGAVA